MPCASSPALRTHSIAQNGFAIIPDVFTGDEIAAVIREINDGKLPRSRAGLRHAMRIPVVAEFARDPRLLNIAREVLGPDAFPFRATLFDKSPDSNWLVVWHQDTALPLRERHELPGWGPWSVKEGILYAHAPAEALDQVLALRMHLDDSIPSNGPLRVVPGTHTLGVLTDEQIEKLTREREHVECTVRTGGILAMRPLIVHASSKSHDDAARRVLHIEYAAAQRVCSGIELATA
jgi:ectoine hydroxylase-related dioxygenase (phytanoyl-CoA dioxygenase family)